MTDASVLIFGRFVVAFGFDLDEEDEGLGLVEAEGLGLVDDDEGLGLVDDGRGLVEDGLRLVVVGCFL